MTSSWRALLARARRFAGYPLATVAFYGPDDRVATKVAVAIIPVDGGDVEDLKRWYARGGDVRDDDAIASAVLAFTRARRARSVAMIEQIIGCPHEEGVDYPLGATCPQCPFWAGRDRWAGLSVDDAVAQYPVAVGPRPTYVTDLRHFLAEDGTLPEMPGPALSLALHLGAIVEWMTMTLSDDTEVTNVYCRRRPHRRRCRGQILARFDPESDAIEWHCPACGDNGFIYGWDGTRWDRSEWIHGLDDAPDSS
jgi:hypothetical protein